MIYNTYYLLALRIFILVILLSIKSQAQNFQYFESEFSQNKSVMGFTLRQQFASNSLTSGFVLDYLNGKFITEEQKNQTIANFKNKTIKAGEQFNLSLNYQKKLGESRNFLFFELGESFFYETQFHEDIFILLFKGNKSFENKTALLNPLVINSHLFFYLKTGLHRYGNRLEFKWNVSYIAAQRLLELETSHGGLFTATDGRFIDLDLQLRSYDFNPISNTLFKISGHGLFTDLIVNYKLSQSSEVGAGLEGLGFINWDQGVTERIVDTSYRFEGFEVSDILDSFSVDIKNPQELKSSFIKERQNISKKTNLPYIVYLQYSQFLIPDFLQLRVQYGMRNSDISDSFLFGAANLFISRSKLFGLNAGTGGYGKLNIGAHFAMNFSNNSMIQLYFNSISNLIVPSREMNLTGGMIYRKTI